MNHPTPAPWTIHTHRDKFGSHGTRIMADGLEIAHVYHYTAESANARLIAAAPELLEAAENVETMYRFWKSHFPNDITLDPYLEKARAAIAKAKGTS